MAGHLKKASADGVKFLREVRMRPGDDDLKQGDRVLVDQFKPTDKVDVIGVSKGRGFRQHHQAASFQAAVREPRIDVPSRAWFHRGVELSFARVSREPAWPATRATSR